MSVFITSNRIMGIKEDGEKVRIWDGALIHVENEKLDYALVVRYTVYPKEGKIRVREVQTVVVNNGENKLSSEEAAELLMKYMRDESMKHDDPNFLVEVREKLYKATEKSENIGDYLGVHISPMTEYLKSDEVNEYLSNIVFVGVELIPDIDSKSGYRSIGHVVSKAPINTIFEALEGMADTIKDWKNFSK